ncbi:MAG: HAD-IIA family hydrolase [Spirochaetia bacterium]|nr:HAD-IIA family hydrolase [Spirochaetia bacterium]
MSLPTPRGFLIDMDGVVYKGGKPIPSAQGFLRSLRSKNIPFLFVTNHSALTPKALSEKLGKMGLDFPPEQFYSSAEATADYLAEKKVGSVFALAEEGLFSALKKRGIRHTEKNPDAVAIGLDRKAGYNELKKTLHLIQGVLKKKGPFLGTNPDPTYPVEDGDAPECGAYLAFFESMVGTKALVMGKPSPVIYRFAAKKIGIPLKAMAMIGDRTDTDILGAKRGGMKGILVLTGHTSRAMLRKDPVKPDLVVETLEEVRL